MEDAADLQARRGRIQDNVQKVERAFRAYEATGGADHERQVFNRAKQDWQQYLNSVNAVDQLLVQGQLAQAKAQLFQSNAAYGALEQSVNSLVEVNLGFVKENRGSLLDSVNMVTSFAMTLAGLALLGWLAQQVWFYTGLGVMPNLSGSNDALALVLFMLVTPVFTLFFAPLSSWRSRQQEFEADAYAVSQTPGKDLSSALLKLYQDNASTLTPDPLYSSVYDSHPPAAIRIAHLQAATR